MMTDAPTQQMYATLVNMLFARALARLGGSVCDAIPCHAHALDVKALSPLVRLVFADVATLHEHVDGTLEKMQRAFRDVVPRDAHARVLFSPLRCVWTRAGGLVLLYEYRVVHGAAEPRAAPPKAPLRTLDLADDETRRVETALLRASAARD